MTGDLGQFTIGLRDFIEQKVPEDVRKLRNAIALEAHRGVVQMTPVDTGRLRANWSVTTDPSASGADPEHFDPTGNATIAEGAAVIGSVSDPWTPISLHNGIEYAKYVNNGTARTRAVHMVERTVSRIQRMFQ